MTTAGCNAARRHDRGDPRRPGVRRAQGPDPLRRRPPPRLPRHQGLGGGDHGRRLRRLLLDVRDGDHRQGRRRLPARDPRRERRHRHPPRRPPPARPPLSLPPRRHPPELRSSWPSSPRPSATTPASRPSRPPSQPSPTRSPSTPASPTRPSAAAASAGRRPQRLRTCPSASVGAPRARSVEGDSANGWRRRARSADSGADVEGHLPSLSAPTATSGPARSPS